MILLIPADIVCASTHITVRGPFDENGNEPSRTTLQRVDADYDSPIVIRCQVTIPANVMNNFNPRLRFYLPRDSSLCKVPSGNDSHTNLVNECGGFNYIYYEDKDATIINFAYHIIPIARMDLSVVNCGVEYAQPPTFCFGHLAAVISFQDDPTCNPPSSMTNETTETGTTTKLPIITDHPTTNETIETGTTTELQKTTDHPTTDDKTTTPKAETPTNKTTTLNTPSKIDTTTPYIIPPTAAEISVEKDTFFSAVGIVVLVGIILLSANFIQLYVIIKRRRVAAIDLPDECGERRLDHRDRRGIELEGVLENSMAKESG